jgi:hypothetical protein
MRVANGGRLFAGIAALLFTAEASLAAEPGFVPIEVGVGPIHEFRSGQADGRFGALEFRGGLTLRSANSDFGALSGLDFRANGMTFYAVSDEGFWFTARIVEEGGRLVGIENAMLAPMLGDGGEPLVGKQESDAEGLRIVTLGGVETALVSFEQVADVRAFAATPDFASARPRHVTLPATVGAVESNYGLEAIAIAPADSRLGGATIVIAERSLDRNGNHRGFILDGPLAGPFALRRIGDYDVTDATFLPDGDLLVLERRFNLADGVGMRLRRMAGSTIMPGATADGPVVIVADMSYQIDNMEGLAVRTGRDGETLVTLVSDDNHSMLQRTILLEFELKPLVPPLPRLRPRAAVSRSP